ncbi:OmpH family outer membrane protein [Halodesulfovibrio marinisediminis]|uniref:Periplasmic chaperone for outer membrane proteins Skp n=1 Tax=Halodesulfovibrio marinisediminis DSM 17456 TaxID=1121457 RepID=A0A1N6HYV3_9BACT|nr:OmpH family outer membrane protein [Halodesulfovibrio marinisediminis]SIO24819.1 periplasmic chaperone for outer membrane proteins Skp [Halodesulfovibrio marinisediminis DSM 17456]
MKKLVLLCVAVCCLALVGCQQEMKGDASPKVAVVDPAKVFQDCQPGKDGMAYLEKVSAEVQQQFKDLQKEAAETKGQNPNVVSELQAEVAKIQERVSAEQQMVVSKLNDLFQKVLEQYRKENNVSLVIPIEQALSYDKSVDATDEIVAIMNKEKVTFESPALASDEEKNVESEAEKVADEAIEAEKKVEEQEGDVAKQVEEKKDEAPADKLVDTPDAKDTKKQ